MQCNYLQGEKFLKTDQLRHWISKFSPCAHTCLLCAWEKPFVLDFTELISCILENIFVPRLLLKLCLGRDQSENMGLCRNHRGFPGRKPMFVTCSVLGDLIPSYPCLHIWENIGGMIRSAEGRPWVDLEGECFIAMPLTLAVQMHTPLSRNRMKPWLSGTEIIPWLCNVLLVLVDVFRQDLHKSIFFER